MAQRIFLIFSLIAIMAGIDLRAAEKQELIKQKPLPVEEFNKFFEKVPTDKVNGLSFAPGVYIGTAGSKDSYNSLTLGWGATGILWSKPVAIVYVRENRYSFRFFEKSDIFVLSWYPRQHMQKVLKIFGGTSGRDTDKEKLSGFTPVETPEGGVTYLQADKVVVCRKILRSPVPKEYVPKELQAHFNQDGFIHIQYTGEVLGVWRRK